MKKEFKVEGMMCNHCRMSVEKTLNRIEGVQASVTLNPPVAIVEYDETIISPVQLREALSEAGDYKLSEHP